MLQDKKQTDNQNQNILQKIQNAILASAAKWWMPLCHSDCWCSATHPLMNSIVPLTNQVLLFAGVTNTANMSQWEAVVTVSLFFQPLHPHTINPTASTHRHKYYCTLNNGQWKTFCHLKYIIFIFNKSQHYWAFEITVVVDPFRHKSLLLWFNCFLVKYLTEPLSGNHS